MTLHSLDQRLVGHRFAIAVLATMLFGVSACSASDEGSTKPTETNMGGQTATATGGTSGSGGTGTATGTGTGTGGTSATGGAGKGGTASGGATTGTTASTKFSFFMASQAGMFKLSGSANGFGGDLRFGKADGLSGADEICRQLAEISLPGNGKTWRAFLSVTKGPNGTPVNAIDRIGEGPWYDRVGRVFAMTKAALLNARPQGADATIINDFPNEDGTPNHNPTGTEVIDNHNTLTGSSASGNVDNQGLRATCQDWTSSASNGGSPRCGVSWPRASLIHWISVLNEGGCAPGATPGNGADSGPQGTVGALGGYGGIYCFALTP